MDDRKWTELKISLKKSIGENNFNNWLSPVEFSHVEEGVAIFTVPTNFLGNYVYQNFGEIIVAQVSSKNSKINRIRFEVDSDSNNLVNSQPPAPTQINFPKDNELAGAHLDKRFTFDAFVVGKPNELAHAAARRVAEGGDVSFNPLFLYGGVGLGKTHLMHAIAWELSNRRPDINVLYLSAEQFMYRFVQALRERKMMDFKQLFRSVDILMVDDVQFIAGKGSTQEEFFHTFNALLEGQKQIILTCDRYPKEVNGLEERLKSRFGWGLTVAIEPPELETSVAILMKKANSNKVDLPHEVAFFIGKRFRSNVRELEGALHRVVANAHFTGSAITLDFAKEALKDLLAMQDRLVTIENIQKTVAEYYKIRVSDLLSKRRSSSVARPRQVAMTLSKELTNHSLPEIGDAFGGRDHSTVIHANKKIAELRSSNSKIEEDYANLERILTS